MKGDEEQEETDESACECTPSSCPQLALLLNFEDVLLRQAGSRHALRALGAERAPHDGGGAGGESLQPQLTPELSRGGLHETRAPQNMAARVFRLTARDERANAPRIKKGQPKREKEGRAEAGNAKGLIRKAPDRLMGGGQVKEARNA